MWVLNRVVWGVNGSQVHLSILLRVLIDDLGMGYRPLTGVEACRELVHTLGLGRKVILVGHSAGGAVAAKVAEK